MIAAITSVRAEAASTTESATSLDLLVEFAGSDREPITIPREKLYTMGVEKVEVMIPYAEKTVTCTILPVRKLYAYLEVDHSIASAAESYDGYYSIYPTKFVQDYDPYLVLDFDGVEKGSLKLEGTPELGPFYITFAAPLVQGSDEMPDPDNKRPFGVTKMTLGSYDDLLGFMYEGAFANLDAAAKYGRELYTNNCMSCHAWTAEGPGGVFSNRTAQILSVHAKFNRDYFSKYIINPTQFIPDVKMPKHPHYADEEIDALIAFLSKIEI